MDGSAKRAPEPNDNAAYYKELHNVTPTAKRLKTNFQLRFVDQCNGARVNDQSTRKQWSIKK
jgi:hypothetical protein